MTPRTVEQDDLRVIIDKSSTPDDVQAAVTRIAVASWNRGWQAAVEEIAQAIAMLAVRQAQK